MVKDTVYAQPVGALMDFLREDPVKLLLIGNGTVLEAFRDAYLVGLDDPPHVVRSEETYLEILARGVSKGEALTAVCQSMGIPLSAVVAFGDSYNDMEMLERAGLGVAMGTSPPAVKARAGHVTAGTREDGVASALWRFVL